MMGPRLAVAGFVLAVVSTLVHAAGFGYDELRRPLTILAAALVLVGGAVSIPAKPDSKPRGEAGIPAKPDSKSRGEAGIPAKPDSRSRGVAGIPAKPDSKPRGEAGRFIHIASNLGLFVLALSAVFAVNRTQAVAALFPAIVAWIFLRGTALGWIPRGFLERQGLMIVSVVGSLFSILGIIQALGWDGLGIATDAANRVHPVSTIGNTNYAGALSAAFAVVGLASAFFESKWRRAPGVGAALAGSIHVAVSHSMGGLLGLGAGLIALTALLVRRLGWKPVALIPLALIVAGVAPAAKTTVQRVSAIARGEDPTSRIRLGLWRGAGKLAAAHPVLGCGTGNFQMEFPPYRDPEERRLTQVDNKVGYTEATDPHNSYLAVLSESGPIALLSLLAVLALAVVAGFRRGAAPLTIVAASGLVALSVSGMFNSLVGHLPFAVLAGLLAGGVWPVASEVVSAGWRRFVTIAAAILLVAAAIPWLEADIHYREGMRTSKPEERLASCQAATAALPGHWAARLQVARCWRAIGDAEGTVRAELREVLRVHPHCVAAMLDLSTEADDEEEWLKKIEAIAPEFPVVHSRFVGVCRRKGDTAGARVHLMRILEVMPDEVSTLYTIGRTWLWERRFEEAVPWFRRAIAKDPSLRKQLGIDHPEVKGDPRFKDLVEP